LVNDGPNSLESHRLVQSEDRSLEVSEFSKDIFAHDHVVVHLPLVVGVFVVLVRHVRTSIFKVNAQLVHYLPSMSASIYVCKHHKIVSHIWVVRVLALKELNDALHIQIIREIGLFD